MTVKGRTVLRTLTPQERAVLGLVAAGLGNRKIAERIETKHQVAKNYVSQLLTKTGTRCRTELVIFALHHGIIECPCRRQVSARAAVSGSVEGG